MRNNERTHLLENRRGTDIQGGVDDDVSVHQLSFSERCPPSLSYRTYAKLFGRQGLLSSAPLPGPQFPKEGVDGNVQMAYFLSRDAFAKMFGFFVMQSFSANMAYQISEAYLKPPGQQFDIRFAINQHANMLWSVFQQFKNFNATQTLSPIAWLVMVPAILMLILLMSNFLMSSSVKEKTAQEFSKANTWKEFFKIYGFQSTEIILASVIINAVSLSLGSPTESTLNNPTLINGLKVALALGMDLLLNSAIFVAQKKSPCCQPARVESIQPS